MKMKHVQQFGLEVVNLTLTTALTLSLGFLSFTGAFFLTASIWWSLGAFFIATLIETKVLHANIIAGSAKLSNPQYLAYTLTDKFLKRFARQQEHSEFLTLFFEYREYLVVAEKHHDNLDAEGEHKRHRALKRYREMLQHVHQYLLNPANYNSPYKEEFDQLFTDQDAINTYKDNYESKQAKTNYILAFAFLSSISCFIVTYASMTQDLTQIMALLPSLYTTGIGLTIANLFPLMLAVSIIAGIGYCLVTFNTTMDLIQNDSLSKFYKVFNQEKDKMSVHALYIPLLVGLGAFVSLATGVTWWRGLDPVATATIPAVLISVASITCYALAQLAFNIENTYETLKLTWKFKWSKQLQKIKQHISKRLQRENSWQKYNPFRICIIVIRMPIRIGMFIAHVLSIGAISDNFVNYWLSAIAGAITETFEDSHYFFFDNHKHAPTQNDHDHGDPLNFVFVIGMSPVFFFSAVWDYGFSQLNDKHSLSFSDALSKSFGVKKTKQLDELPKNIPDRWQAVEFKQRYQKKQRRGNNDFLKQNAQRFKDMQGEYPRFFANLESSDTMPSTTQCHTP